MQCGPLAAAVAETTFARRLTAVSTSKNTDQSAARCFAWPGSSGARPSRRRPICCAWSTVLVIEPQAAELWPLAGPVVELVLVIEPQAVKL